MAQMGRPGQLDEVAAAVVFVASELKQAMRTMLKGITNCVQPARLRKIKLPH